MRRRPHPGFCPDPWTPSERTLICVDQTGIDFALVEELIRETGVAAPHELSQLAQNAIRIKATFTDLDHLTIGASRLGGVPDVPIDFDWPTYEGTPFTFLAQINLSELKSLILPSSGWLLIFLNEELFPWNALPEEKGGFRVIYLNASDKPLFRRQTQGQFEPSKRYSAKNSCRSVVYSNVVSLAGLEDLAASPMLAVDNYKFEYEYPDEWKAYELARRRLLDVEVDLTANPHPNDYHGIHQILGHPLIIQNDMRRECSIATLPTEVSGNYEANWEVIEDAVDKLAGEWQLLLQLDSEESYIHVGDDLVATNEWCWIDMGKLYFWIKKVDLAARRFDGCWLTMQT